MEQIWYLPNLIALICLIAVLVWQSMNYTGYARKQQDDCEEDLEKERIKVSDLSEQLTQAKIQRERMELLLMGAGITITGGHVIIKGDMVGGDSHK